MFDGGLKRLLERCLCGNEPIYNGSGMGRTELLLAIAIGVVGGIVIAIILI